jgi:hypothetical protein
VQYSVATGTGSEVKFNIEVPKNNNQFTAADRVSIAEMFETLYCQVEPMSVLAVIVPDITRNKRSRRNNEDHFKQLVNAPAWDHSLTKIVETNGWELSFQLCRTVVCLELNCDTLNL